MIDLCLIDRLQVLNYDEELRKEIKMKPMSRYYFLVPGNAGEQFHVFTSLAAWLLRKIGRSVEQPQEDDDPNFTISNILDNMRELDIAVDFSPNKLKQGYGDFVIYVLEKLTEKALKSTAFEWKPLNVNQIDETKSEDVLQDDDIDVEEENQTDDIPEDEIYSDDSEDGAYVNMKKANAEDNQEVNVADESLWREEVEKVAPALRIRVAPSARDWRAHLQQLITHKQELNDKTDAVSTGLERISAGAIRVLEATRAREQLLAGRITSNLANLKNQYERTLASYKEVSGGVTQRQEVLNELIEKIEAVKQKTEVKGSAMNDTSPIVNMRKALVTMKKDIQQMDLQLAVLMWTVIDKQSKTKKMIHIEHMN